MTGISKAALSSFERGVTSPTLAHLMPIAAALEIKTKDLFYETSLNDDFGGDEMEEDLREVSRILEEERDALLVKKVLVYIKTYILLIKNKP